MISDIIILAVIILFICIGAKRGIAKTAFGIVGLIITFASAHWLSDFLSQFIYNSCIEQTVFENINNCFNTNGFDYLVSNSLDSIPNWIKGMLSAFGASSQTIAQDAALIAELTAANAVELLCAAIEDITVAVMKIILMVILVIIIYIIVRKLIKLVLKVFKAPVLKELNGFLGGLLGLLQGILFVFAVVNVLCMALNFSANDISANEWLNGWLFRLLSVTV